MPEQEVFRKADLSEAEAVKLAAEQRQNKGLAVELVRTAPGKYTVSAKALNLDPCDNPDLQVHERNQVRKVMKLEPLPEPKEGEQPKPS